MRKPLSQLISYQALRSHALEIEQQSLRKMFAQDPTRYDSFSQQNDYLLLDYSKNRISLETIDKLISLFDECEVAQWRDKMFSGEIINSTENRAVQHTALRNLNNPNTVIAKEQIDIIKRIDSFVNEIHSSNITDVVNIGIGGSHLGPLLVCDALSNYAKSKVNVHFVANVDATEINRVLNKLNPTNTLFIVTSKSFTTQETLTNANTAKSWMASNPKLENDIAKHFVAVSANVEKAQAFGIEKEKVFPMWDEIGGRFSLWSAVGLSIALYLGMSAFRALLDGANVMDEHFKNVPPKKNMPVLLALLDIWNQHFLNANTHAVLPYDVRLSYLPAYLQQLVMESNGKFVDREGNKLNVPSSQVLFGDVGTNAQHSFFQLLHQGTHTISCDFIGVVKPGHNNQIQHDMLLANMIGQTQALMVGQSLEDAQAQGEQQFAAHKFFPGSRVSNSILLTELTPYTLGMLLALYEHKVFVQGIILNINSFDQMGVELGKRLANKILDKMQDSESVQDQDSSTNALLNFYKKYRM